jgi:hypothetical protein
MMRQTGSFGAIAAALVFLVAAPALSQVQLQQAAAGGGDGPEPMPVHAWIGLTQSVGTGTFLGSPNNPTTSTNLSVTPMIMYKGWQILVSQSLGFEWTQSDYTTYANQMELSDTSIGVRQMSLLRFPDQKLSFWPSLGYVVPISLASRQSGSLGTLSGGARANWAGLDDYGFTFFGGVNGGYNILVPSLANSFANSDVKPLNDRHQGPIAIVSCNVRNGQELANYACSDGGLPAVARWGASVGMWWFYLLDGNLGLSANLGYTQSYSIRTGPDDELKATDAAAGLVPRQGTSGDITATYIPVPWLNLSVGAGSSQPFLTADGKGMRFPLWDFVSPYNNFSSFHFDATFVL